MKELREILEELLKSYPENPDKAMEEACKRIGDWASWQ